MKSVSCLINRLEKNLCFALILFPFSVCSCFGEEHIEYDLLQKFPTDTVFNRYFGVFESPVKESSFESFEFISSEYRLVTDSLTKVKLYGYTLNPFVSSIKSGEFTVEDGLLFGDDLIIEDYEYVPSDVSFYHLGDIHWFGMEKATMFYCESSSNRLAHPHSMVVLLKQHGDYTYVIRLNEVMVSNLEAEFLWILLSVDAEKRDFVYSIYNVKCISKWVGDDLKEYIKETRRLHFAENGEICELKN